MASSQDQVRIWAPPLTNMIPTKPISCLERGDNTAPIPASDGEGEMKTYAEASSSMRTAGGQSQGCAGTSDSELQELPTTFLELQGLCWVAGSWWTLRGAPPGTKLVGRPGPNSLGAAWATAQSWSPRSWGPTHGWYSLRMDTEPS